MTGPDLLLALNVGSSSLKFRLAAGPDRPLLSGLVDRIGGDGARLSLRPADGPGDTRSVAAPDHATALRAIGAVIADRVPTQNIRAIGHRIVHGGDRFTHPAQITPSVLADLEHLVALAPLHLPHGIAGIKASMTLWPAARQVACFDTAFHADQPWINAAFALPRTHFDAGVRRYGFHGLSCQSVVRGLQADGFDVPGQRFVIAHLGNGCSVTAVRDGRSVANSMGFSTLDGLTMGTRCGHIDPGVLLHLLRGGMTAGDLETLLYRQSGLLGLSGLSNDMRDLSASCAPEAAQAIAYFNARLVEEISRLAGVLGGLDAVVFCGGIGENSAPVRAAVREGLGFLPGVAFRVQATDEEREILFAAHASVAG